MTNSSDSAAAGTPARQSMRITLVVVGTTDRDGYEWGDGLARWLEAELNETGNAAFGPIKVECADVEKVR